MYFCYSNYERVVKKTQVDKNKFAGSGENKFSVCGVFFIVSNYTYIMQLTAYLKQKHIVYN